MGLRRPRIAVMRQYVKALRGWIFTGHVTRIPSATDSLASVDPAFVGRYSAFRGRVGWMHLAIGVFCDELTVKQAALVILNVDPGDIGDYVDGWEPHKRPGGYTAVLSAMQHAIISERLRATVIKRDLGFLQSDASHPVARIDWHATRVLVDDLKDWHTERGARPSFFFPVRAASVEYLDPQHPNFSQKNWQR